MVVKRFDVYLIALDPTIGTEIKNPRLFQGDLTRRDEPTLPYGHRGSDDDAEALVSVAVACTFGGKKAEIALDRIRTVDLSRLVKRLESVGIRTQEQVLEILAELVGP